jgi:hypothetical protein
VDTARDVTHAALAAAHDNQQFLGGRQPMDDQCIQLSSNVIVAGIGVAHGC